MRSHRYFFCVLVLTGCSFIFSSVRAQTTKTISGTVIDSATQLPLALATVTVKETNKRALTDADGFFSLKRVAPGSILLVSYTGYAMKQVRVPDSTASLRIVISRKTDALNEVVVTSDLNPAHRIILLMQQHRKENDPTFINSYEYNAYTITELGGTEHLWNLLDKATESKPEKISKPRKKQEPLDTIEDRRTDSLIGQLKNNYLFVAESYTNKKYRYPRKVKETVLATKMSGIKNPLLAITTANFEYFGFYFDYPKINDRVFTSPMVSGSIAFYKFSLRELIPHAKDTTYVINYEPRAGKNFLGLKGTLYINTDRYAIEKVTAMPADESALAFSFKLQQEYARVSGQWFPRQIDMYTTEKDLKKDSVVFYLNTRTALSNISLHTSFPASGFSDVAMEFPRDAGKRSEAEWQQLRPDTLDIKDRITYQTYDSMPKDILGVLNLINNATEAIALQAIPAGKVDLPFKYMISGVNPYEKFRIGAGVQTNQLFSKWLSVGGYAGYGVGDKAWKYGANLLLTFNRRTHTELRFSFSQDLREPGTVPYFLDNQSLYSTRTLRNFFSSRLDSVREWKLMFNTKLWPNFQANTWLLTEQRGPAGFDYGFTDGNNTLMRQYQNTELGIGFRYTTRETFARIGRALMENTRPRRLALLQLSRGLPGTLGGQLDYTKLAMQFFQRFNTKSFGETSFQLELGKIWGNVPYGYLFNVPAVGQQQRRLAGGLFVSNNFQTVGPYEFTASDNATLFFQQRFGNLLFKPGSVNFRPQLVLVQNISYGKLAYQEKHSGINLQAPEKGLYETGLLINNLYRLNLRFFYLGIEAGVFYRYGYYALADQKKNWAFKFGVNLSY